MSSTKLYYFPGRGGAEPIRFILAQAEVKYEDIRIGSDKWPEFKPQTPFGVMPVLEEGGKMLGGSMVIARYLGEKYGLAGSNAWENAQVANVADFIVDLMKELGKIHFEKDKGKKEELISKFQAEIVPKYFGKLNELANNDTSYLWGNKPTWADFALFVILEPAGFYTTLTEGDLSGYPALQKFVSTISALPNVAKWYAERPNSQF